jgi:phosphatidylserine/phosphatidylglycerophosphate/cardiolipin synthase-like enzyme
MDSGKNSFPESDAYTNVRRLIIQPVDGIDPILSALNAAKTSVRMKQFTLTDQRIIGALLAAHSRGVKTRVMLNPNRPDQSRDNDNTMEQLKKMGVETQWANPKFAITHEKTIVIDENAAFINTFNLAEKYFSDTRDYGIITTDVKQVRQIVQCFDADWDRAPFTPLHYAGLVWSVLDSRERMAFLIDYAKKTLDIQHPKFVDTPILDRLVAARERGVRIRYICSGKHGVQNWDRPETFASFRVLKSEKAKIHVLKEPKLHAKLIIRDGKEAMIGSMNIHRRAFDDRRELGIIFDEHSLVDRLMERFELDWEESKVFEIPDPLEKYDGSDSEGDKIWLT